MDTRSVLFLLLAAASLSAASAADPQPAGPVWRRVPLGNHGAVLLPAPADWRASASRVGPVGPPTLELLPPAGAPPSFRVTVLINPLNTPKSLTNEDVGQLCAGLKKIRRDDPAATARTSPVLELGGEFLKGCYVSGLQPTPAEGAFRYKTQGAGILDQFVINFTALSTEADEPAVTAMLDMMKAARHEPGVPVEHKPLRIALWAHGALDLQIPGDWIVTQIFPQAGSDPQTVHLEPSKGDAFLVDLEPRWPAPGAPPFGLADVRASVEKSRDKAARSATTHDLLIQELSGDLAHGYYFSAVYKHCGSAPGRRCHVTQGVVLVDDLFVDFTVSSNDPNEPEAAATLEMLRWARRE